MPELPFKFIPIGAILGDYEAGESLAIPVVVSPGGSKNMTLDKVSRALSIGGHVKRNAAAITSDTGAAAMRIRHLYHHITTVGTVRTRRELAIFESLVGDGHYELRSSTDRGATWTFLREFGVLMIGQIPSFAQMGTTLLLCNGVGAPQKINPATPSVIDAGAAQAVPPVIVDTGIGLLTGTKRWKVLAILTDGSRLAASKPSNRTQLVSRKVSVTWNAVVDPAGALDVESYEVYSTSGTGALFFFEQSVPAGTLTVTSNIADIDLVQNRLLQEHGDAPPFGARYAVPHKQRMFYIGSPAFPRRGWYSDAGLPESVFVDQNYFDFTDANESDFADEATGGTGAFLGMLVVWLERSVWTLSGPLTISGSVINAERRRTSATAGAVHARAVARIPAGASYIDERGTMQTTIEVRLAYLTPFGDLRMFDGDHDIIIGYPKADLFARLNYENRKKSYVVVDTMRTEATWVFPHDDATEPSTAVTWNWQAGTMTERPAWAFGHALQIDTAENASTMLAGEGNVNTGAFCYELWSGTTLGDGVTPVNGTIMFKTLYGANAARFTNGATENEAEMMSIVKRWRWIDLLVKTFVQGALGGPVQFIVDCWPEEAEPTDPPYATQTIDLPTEQLYTADGVLLLTADGSPLTAPVATPILRVKLRQVSASGKMRYLHSRGVRIRITTTTTTASWALIGANVAYQLLDGLQRTYHRPQRIATVVP